MMHCRNVYLVAVIAASFSISGCATLCSWTDTGMGNPGPYSGVRSTMTDWRGRTPPWAEDSAYTRIPVQIYFRTIDVPLSLVADTLFLPFALWVDAGTPKTPSSSPNDK